MELSSERKSKGPGSHPVGEPKSKGARAPLGPGGSSGSNRRRQTNKIRVHLPPIESYEKELEFTADAPGRVVVRLERLMGTDRIRLTDTKYMSTLLERLEQQERKEWAKRRFRRIKSERNRSRQLAIDGLMEPDDDMQDLKFHPVFRVNRVLKKLAKMDTNITLTPHDSLPPITEIDPFVKDGSGKSFRYYPGHALAPSVSKMRASRSTASRATTLPRISSSRATSSISTVKNPPTATLSASPSPSSTPSHVVSKKSGAVSASKATLKQSRVGSQRHSVVSTLVVAAPPTEPPTETQLLLRQGVPPLSEMQENYQISGDHDLSEWEPFRSWLVDAVFHEEGQGVEQLYYMASEVLGVYEREGLTADDAMLQIGRIMRDQAH